MALMSCPECKTQVSDRAVSCPSCGCPIGGSVQSNSIQEVHIVAPPKSRGTHQVLALFLGQLGVHNFYAGYTTRGAIKLMLLSLFLMLDISTRFYSAFFIIALVINAIWALVELFSVTEDATGKAMI
jgi:TM2 domain-containing membrane protein YozV